MSDAKTIYIAVGNSLVYSKGHFIDAARTKEELLEKLKEKFPLLSPNFSDSGIFDVDPTNPNMRTTIRIHEYDL